MIKIVDKRECCGCGACVQCCPKQCIIFNEDEEGFFYPNVNEEECIDCGLCNRVCPLLQRKVPQRVLNTYAAKNQNVDDLRNSSSGGVFILLARKIIDRGG